MLFNHAQVDTKLSDKSRMKSQAKIVPSRSTEVKSDWNGMKS